MAYPQLTTRDVVDILKDALNIAVETVEAMAPGAWSSAFAFRYGGQDLVIRFSHLRDDFERDAYAASFHAPRLPIPRITHRGMVGDLHYAVSERVRGEYLDELDGSAFRTTLPSLIRTLDALRQADVSASTGYGTWDANGNGLFESWPAFLIATLEDDPDFRGGPWRAKLETSPTGASAFDRDATVFRDHASRMPNLRHVIHSDLINRNCFVRDHEIAGIIDWGCALYGDFVYEIAWFAFWRPWYSQWTGTSVVDTARAFYRDQDVDLSGFEERLLCYQIHIGLTHQIYNASIGRLKDLADTVRLTAALTDQLR